MRSIRPRRVLVLTAAAMALVLLLPAQALGHAERDVVFPDGNGTTPQVLRSGPKLVVCKGDSSQLFGSLPTALRERNERLYRECMQDGFRNIQAAVDAVQERNTRILVLPGVYQELPSRRAWARGCDGRDGDTPESRSILSYAEQRQCPHVQNLVGIFGDSGDPGRECDLPQCGLQIEGTGASPTDVILDGGFRVPNGIRADRLDGARFLNFTVQRFESNALYVLQTDGFLIQDMLGRWTDEYSFLTFASDHGLYNRCESYGNGDGALYPGSASDINNGTGNDPVERFAIEIKNCRGHHSALGYSGTAGNSVYAHDNSFDHNQSGVVTDSIFPNHPGLPQNHARFEDNRIFSNNTRYVKYVQNGTCDKPIIKRGYEHGTVCPTVPAPVGAGLVIAGGNYNRIVGNSIFDNWRAGTYQIHVPAPVREEYDPEKQFDTSHFNRYRDNRMGFGPSGYWQPNKVDFWWDDQGEGNCWEGNVAKQGEPTHNATDPRGLPSCPEGSENIPINAVKLSQIAACATYNRDDEEFRDPPNCDFFDRPSRPDGREPGAPRVRRTAGGNRFTVATGVSRDVFAGGSDAVVVAPGFDEPAALVAAPLAAQVDGPLLLTRRRTLSDTTADEIRRLDAERVYVVGRVSPRVLRRLRDQGAREVRVVAGRNRYRTAAQVARLMGGTEVYVARGTQQDPAAIGLAGLAASQERPIVLSGRRTLPAAAKTVLEDMEVINATLYGKRRHLAATVRNGVARRVVITDRMAQPRRFQLSAAAVRLAVRGIADESKLWVVKSKSTDAAAAATAVAQRDGAVLLVNGRDLEQSRATRRYLRNHGADLRLITIAGGSRRVSDQVKQQIKAVTQ